MHTPLIRKKSAGKSRRVSRKARRKAASSRSEETASPAGVPLFLQRTTHSPASQASPQMEEEKEAQGGPSASVQAKSESGAKGSTSPSVARTVKSPSEGSPLSDSVKSRVEPVLQSDLSQVRVHDDAKAHDAAQQLNAKAFTHRNNIFLGKGQQPSDLGLMAHEAAHTVQQEANDKLTKALQMKGKPASVPKDALGKIAAEFKAFVQTQGFKNAVLNKPNVTDKEIINEIHDIIIKFKNSELKRQIGSSLINRKDFLIGMTPYLGSLQKVVDHFSDIEAVVDVPGDVHLHESAASRLRLVKEVMKGLRLPMPASYSSLGLRNRYRPHTRTSKGFNAHPMGFALDFRVPSNPKVTDKRLVALMQIQTGEDNNFVFKDEANNDLKREQRRKLISDMGKRKVSKTVDEKGKAKADHFLAQFENEFHRVAKASKMFVTDISPYVAEARDVWMSLRNKKNNINKASKGIKTNQRKLTRAEKNLERKMVALDKQERALESIKKEILVFQKERDELQGQGQKVPGSLERQLARTEKKGKRIKKKIDKAKAQQVKAQKAQDDVEARVKSLEKKIENIEDAEERLEELKKDLPNLTRPWLNKVRQEIKETESKAAAFVLEHQALEGFAGIAGADLLTKNDKELKTIYKAALKTMSGKDRKKFNISWKKFEGTRVWYHQYIKPLENSLLNDPEFVLGEVKKEGNIKRKPVMYIIGYGGFFTPDDDAELIAQARDDRPIPDESKSGKQGFNLEFMKAMARHGFDQGISWSPTNTDAMHFELVEGVESTLEKPKNKK